MSTENNSSMKICPTCGTRVNVDSPRCLVCGTTFTQPQAKKSRPAKQEASIQGSRMPTFTMSVPIIVILLILFVGIGGGLTYTALNLTGGISQPTEEPTPTNTLIPTGTTTPELPTPTSTAPPSPTPFSYVVQANDVCSGIAFTFNVSVTSIIVENALSANCDLSVGMELRIPHPTPTPTPLATNTPSSQQATIEACEKAYHTVQENETLSLIAVSYEVPIEYIMEWSGKSVDIAYYGETLTIPLCLRSSVAGATVTPSPAPDYPAPELLRPRNGEAFTLENDTVSLQWAAVGELRENEFYLVTVVDVTSGQNSPVTVAVQDTKFLLPATLRPADDVPHIFSWNVVPVVQVGVDEDGNPRYREGGLPSQPSYFTWIGTGPQGTPQP
jgi:LysM repeat protein